MISINDMIDGKPSGNSRPSVSDQIKAIVESDKLGKIGKLVAIFDVYPVFIKSIAIGIKAAIVNENRQVFLVNLKADHYLKEMTADQFNVISNSIKFANAIAPYLSIYNLVIEGAYILGNIVPSFCDMCEALVTIYEKNFNSVRAFACRLTDRSDELISVAFEGMLHGFSIMKDIRTKARAIEIANNEINGNTDSSSDSKENSSDDSSNSASNSSSSQKYTDEKAREAAKNARFSGLADSAINSDDALLNPKD